ncbi:acyl-CoA dehydrogenase [Tepidiforma thermophila]|uniref:Alkylation response protein AidB-like acyl-CoA dehydrogenase n=1 Tax=Tepidiforma thermophila (strain KCTC 52669 / CGMCC 1.13589 / G233) TaxID=2761530 RepID=A0A2A9HCU3_TEPT2|nr:acyl-CoA dehydrogenase [Tepidiforma thermophila]PFG73827.1 alkylation response protein AidB-like acyl-CoA dehydrogenase [Tepidiforma thermophila]
MEFKFTAEHEALRKEVRDFLAEALPNRGVGPVRPTSQENWEEQLAFNKKLAKKGWIAPAWPKEYGGLGWSHINQMIFSEELSYAGAPDGGRVFNVGMIGPTLIVHGTPEQKAEHLPRITNAEVTWCQGYSEPGAGSDLASLQTRAVRDGDDYIVNGQKIWTTGAHHADWCFLLVRTDPDAPKHKGISFLLVDMKTPGITVRPLINMAGYHEFNEVFFEDVRVPVRNRVGEENRGWYVAMTLLDFERSNVASIAANQRQLELLMQLWRERRSGEAYRDILRHRIADLWVANEVGRMLAYRIAWMQEAGRIPNYEASVIKVFATELAQRITNFGVNLFGPAGALEPDSKYAVANGIFEKGHLVNVAPTIYSGSSEIQRNIIAQRGLGLPRD